MNKKALIITGVIVLLLVGIFSGYFFLNSFGKTKTIEKINQTGSFNGISLISNENHLKTASFISPHHLVAEKMIDEIFIKIAQENNNAEIERIILISPNHFNLGNGWIIASDKNWETKIWKANRK